MLRRTFIKSGCALSAGVGTLVLVESKISYYDVVEHYKEVDSITEEEEEFLIEVAKSVVKTNIGILAVYYAGPISSATNISFEIRKKIMEIIAPLIISYFNTSGCESITGKLKKEMIKVAKENFI